jgi:UDP-2,3-diacylglucosamine pyrophosphatase LpxH
MEHRLSTDVPAVSMPCVPMAHAPPVYYRSIWISDFHLGTPRCKTAALLDFLRTHRAEYLFLVGDIIDGWNFGRTWYWDADQTAVVEEIAAWRKQGARVVILPGNHDQDKPDLIRALCGPVEVRDELVHRTAQGLRMLVLHGHQFLRAHHPDRWMFLIGGRAYSTALQINLWYNRESRRPARRVMRGYLRRRLKRAVHYLADFDDRPVFEAASERGVDGVISGHTHRPGSRTTGPYLYINDGDWVQSRTALVEHADGALALMQYDRGEMRQFESEPYRWAAAS